MANPRLGVVADLESCCAATAEKRDGLGSHGLAAALVANGDEVVFRGCFGEITRAGERVSATFTAEPEFTFDDVDESRRLERRGNRTRENAAE